jgi:gliding motility-associated-like protein
LNLKNCIFFLYLLCLTAALNAQNFSNIEFVQNKGQWDSRVKYLGQIPAGSFFIRSSGFTVLQYNHADLERIYDKIHSHTKNDTPESVNEKSILRSHSYNVDFIGSSPAFEIVPDKPVNVYNNYFIGNDPSQWATDCKIYQAVTLKNIYPGIDVRYYTEGGRLKYDLIARPGADISKIAMKYEGVDKIQIKNKELVIGTSVEEVKELSPYTYQLDGKSKKELNAKYIIKDNIVRFDIKGYDRNSTLVIDPTLVFCSFTGSQADNWGYTATYGPDGSMYGGGIVFQGSNGNNGGFPASPGAFQQTFQGGSNPEPVDIGIIKLSPNGQNRMYATYVGGSGNEQPHSLVVDGQGNLVLAGRSNSSNYPTTGAGQIGPGGDWDIVVTKLNATGTALIGSKKIGGANADGLNIAYTRSAPNSLVRNYGDDGRSEVILDGAANIYVASCTQSTDFPIQGGGFQNTLGGKQDAVLLKLTSNVGGLVFSTYVGGSEDDGGYVLALDPGGNIYLAGGTSSLNLPGNAAGTIGPNNHGSIDGFITVVSNTGAAVLRTTYIGTGGIDQVYGIQFDQFGFPYIMGQTTGTWQPFNAAFSMPGGKQFISKLQPDLSANVYTTMFGTGATSPNFSPVAFLVDRCENVYMSGWGGTVNNFPSAGTTGLPVTSDAIKSSTDGNDFYFFVLKKNATAQLYGSFFGQTGGFTDHVDGGTSRFDRNGIIYQAICANCGPVKPNYPTTPGVWAPTNGSSGCNLIMVKIAFNLAGVGGGVQAAINGVPRDTAGCVPLTVDFSDTVRNAKSYEWNFGDGTPTVVTNSPTISHTFNLVGTYTVMLIAIDSTTCNIRDTSYSHIRVGDIQAILNFNWTKLLPCQSFSYRFHNLSTAPRPFTANSFIWDFGDNTPRVTGQKDSVDHTFAGPGTFNIKLILIDTNYCNAPDSIELPLRVAAQVKAQFETPPTGCAPYTAVFNNTSLAGQQFFWDFGDGGTSTNINPTHIYPSPGIYPIKLVAIDSGTCNIIDSAFGSIEVFGNPVANFSYSPIPPIENTPNIFTNLSSPDAVRFKWFFGDGDSLLTTSRNPVQHQYNATGTFNACLIAYNAASCPDTFCLDVTTIIVPVVDVPTGFTPSSGDINSKVFVRGFGISKMKFIIWNRWGQKVFETDNRNSGWDGRFKGVIQPMDVYAYTLEVVFFDGEKASKKGDITLIR